MQVGMSVTVPGLDARACVQAGVEAAAAGAAVVLFGESRLDPIAMGAALAERVTVPVGAGIALWDRDPRSLALGARTVAALTGTPYRLGLGTGPVRGGVAGALARMRTLVADLRRDLGEDERVEVVLAAASPGLAALAGEVADGVLFSRVHDTERLQGLQARVNEAAASRRVERAVLVRCAVAPTEEEGVDRVRRSLVVYELPVLARVLEGRGHDLSEAIAFREAGRLEEAAARVPVALVRDLALVGPLAACREQLGRYDALGMDLVSLFPCGDTPEEAVAGTVELLRGV